MGILIPGALLQISTASDNSEWSLSVKLWKMWVDCAGGNYWTITLSLLEGSSTQPPSILGQIKQWFGSWGKRMGSLNGRSWSGCCGETLSVCACPQPMQGGTHTEASGAASDPKEPHTLQESWGSDLWNNKCKGIDQCLVGVVCQELLYLAKSWMIITAYPALS